MSLEACQFLSDRQVAARYSVHHLTTRRWLKTDPSFPKPVRLSPGCVRWKLSELEAWEAGKPVGINEDHPPRQTAMETP